MSDSIFYRLDLTKEQKQQRYEYFSNLIYKIAPRMFHTTLDYFDIEPKRGLKIFISDKKNRCRGGRDRYGDFNIRMYIGHHINYLILPHVEYARIQNKPDIGALGNVSAKLDLKTITAHEVAHAVQYYMYFNYYNHKRQIDELPFTMRELKKPHGKGWQHIYSRIRKVYIN